MAAGNLTSVQLAMCYVQRILQTDEYTSAIMEMNPDMFEISANLDLERSQGHVRGPLHGIPFIVKDNIATKDKMETTAGAWMLLGSVVPRDAYVVARLREAGALLMGHATLKRNGLVGIKPTVGVIPESHNQDTVGCLTRTVVDGVYCLDGIYGRDPRDNYTLVQESPDNGYTQYLRNSSALSGMSFGLPWLSFWQYASLDMQSQLLELIDIITDAGATVINSTELPSWQQSISPDGWDWDYGTTRGSPNESEYTYVKTDFYNDITAYLANLNNTSIRTLENIMEYNVQNVGSEGGLPNVHPAFKSGQDGFNASLQTRGIMDETYWQALNFCHRMTREDGIDGALFNNGSSLTALLVPSDVGQTYQIAAQAGYPMITLPAGITPETGMPFGLGIMGTAWSEGTLISVASAIEDLQFKSGTGLKRSLPRWLDYRARNVPM
ncbi:putative amidase [Glarea lozoyensis 74030]|uniref:Putative amidase n=1 Tax=Glarea lozoyensis (strain ATCC 74030 / MF5533) TaxID=1104152 RepID=H0EI17_GLAL7|nr:putative amidase [Glarea lozoyensis 74030]